MPTLTEIHRRVDAAGSDDPRHALIAVRKLINDDVPWLERRAIDLARREFWDWVRIARLLMRSRQAVRERFRAYEGLPAPQFESNDPIAELNAAAEVILQQRRDAHAARVAREEATKGHTTAAHAPEPCSAAGPLETGQAGLSQNPMISRPS